ncbi:MAG: DUF805 domain-containing protein [Lachnospiraceae bacterium]|nr:DUF805 domain-containing protein [Lachnospiraceae bacterium]
MEKKDANFFSAQKRLWAGIFNYKGRSTRKEYWFAFLFHFVLGVLAFFGMLISSAIFLLQDFVDASILLNIVHFILLIPAVLILIYLGLSIIPWIALTVRRLRDAGKSGWWTILLLFVGIGHIILLILCALSSAVVGVAFFAANNIQPSVYGPPEWFDPSYNSNEGIYGPPGPDIYDPVNNQNEDVYGPPEWFDEGDDFDPSINDSEPLYGPPPFDEDDYDPSNNENEAVYGPPEWFDEGEEFDPEINLNEDVYGPPEWFEENENDFDADLNMEPAVYGPPEWFE